MLNFVFKKIIEITKKYYFFILLFLLLLLSSLVWWNLFPYNEITSDGVQYHEMAVSLLENGEFSMWGEKTMLREPGYPFFLTIIYKVFGRNLDAIKVCQFILHLFIVFGLYFVSKKIFNKFTAVLSSLIIAVYPIYNIFSGIVMSEILATFLVVFTLIVFYFAIKKRKIILYCFFGIMLGALVLVKSAFLFSAIFFALLILYSNKKEERLQARIKYVFFFIFCFALLVFPWIARNYHLFNRTSLASRSGLVLYLRAVKLDYSFAEISKYAIGSLSGEYIVRRFIDNDYSYEQEGQGIVKLKEFKINNPQLASNLNNYDILDKYLTADAKRIIKEHPIKYFLYGFIELNNLNSPIIYYDRHFSVFHNNVYSNTYFKTVAVVLLKMFWTSFLFLVACGIFYLLKFRIEIAYPLIVVIAVINLPIFFIQGLPRSLMPVLPIYIILAVYGFYELYFNKFKAHLV